MLSEMEALKMIFELFPDFIKYWEKEIDNWGRDMGLHTDAIVFSHYIKDLIINNDPLNAKTISNSFQLAEKLLHEGDAQVKEAITTCFLENMINAVDWGTIPASSFVPLLGPECRKYCKAWDEFSGIKTEGLWDDDK